MDLESLERAEETLLIALHDSRQNQYFDVAFSKDRAQAVIDAIAIAKANRFRIYSKELKALQWQVRERDEII